jgi:tetratricopeptide (TPR) repeat protein/predicted O-methyltransferase YrrM
MGGIIDLAAARSSDLLSKRRDLKTCEASEKLNDAAHYAKERGQRAAAISLQRRAVALSPESWPLWNHLAVLLWDACEYEQAQEAINRAFALAPDHADIHANAGIISASLGRYIQAERHLAIARERKLTDLNVAWSYAMALLDGGEWQRGFGAYECRLARSPKSYIALPYPLWDGSDLNGKTVYVAGEQGYGDRILFSRYLYWLKQRYRDCRILFLPSQGNMPDLVNLFWDYKESGVVDEFVPPAVPWPQADFGIYLVSLARFHGSTPANVPSDPGFIRKRAELDREEARLPGAFVRGALKIGVTWTGSVQMGHNAHRTLPLAELARLMEDPRVQLYSLQGPPGQAELAQQGFDELIYDCWPAIAPIGITATAAVMLDCDLIITCCTAVAHLAGALGVPCWTLLCNDPYWVWGRSGDTTPWYSNMRLYRQARPNDWSDVFSQVRRDLDDLIATSPAMQRRRILHSSSSDMALVDAPWAQQNPQEMAQLLELVRGAKSILEIGSATGQTLKHLARVLAPGALIRSIDLGAFPAEAGRFARKDVKSYLTRTIAELRAQGFDAAIYFGDSHSEGAVAWASNWTPYDLVFIDGDHSLLGVMRDYAAYGRMGKLAGFHDIAGGEIGVAQFWADLKRSGAEVVLEAIASEMGIGVVRVPASAQAAA